MDSKKKKKTGSLRLIAAAMLFIIVIAVVALAIQNGGLDFRKLWNTVTGEKAEEFFYPNTSGGAFAAVGDGFAALSASRLSVFDETGKETVSRLVSFSHPELSSDGRYGAAWDLGGTDIILFTESGIERSFTADNAIISVSVNPRGYICVCTDEPGYAGSATVYNRNGKALYKWSSAANYVLNAKMRDGSELMILTLGGEGSELIRCRISSEDELARYTYSGIILDAEFTDSGVTAVSDKEIIFLDKSFNERSRYSFEEKTLDAYAVSGSFTAIAVGDYQIGGTRRIVTLSDGEVIAESDIAGDIISMDMAGNYISLLYLGEIDIYTYRLAEYASLTPPAGAERVIAREDGSVIAAGAYSARIYTSEGGD